MDKTLINVLNELSKLVFQQISKNDYYAGITCIEEELDNTFVIDRFRLGEETINEDGFRVYKHIALTEDGPVIVVPYKEDRYPDGWLISEVSELEYTDYYQLLRFIITLLTTSYPP